ncbi:glycosyl hydrolase family 17 protein [Raphanus sativus]|nr:glycosyl hydrolase family 17 protein [Raphanus sativus]
MATTPHFFSLPSLLIASVVIFLLSSVASAIGVNYGTLGNLPPPQQVVDFIKTKTIFDSVKIYDANPDILRALAGTGINVTIMVPNGNIPAMANVENARQWVAANVLPFHQQTKIKYICVGNEILLTKDNNLISNLIPAMQSLHKALNISGLPDMKVTTPHAFTVGYNLNAPSQSRFNDDQKDFFAKILEFNRQAKSPFMISAYPYFMMDPNNVNYAIFGPSNAITDTKTEHTYNNMFDSVMDATYSAMNALGYGDVDIAVGETGWPSACDAAWCTPQNAENYNLNIIKRAQNIGTPLMPNRHIDIYIFALFNEDGKSGTAEKNWGLFKPDFSPVYNVGVLRGGETSPPPSSSEKWCVAKQEATDAQLQANIDWVCSQGIDCKNISPGGICFDNNNMKTRSSFIMNVYYQSKGGSEDACNFSGSGVVTTTNPSTSTCVIQNMEDGSIHMETS